MPVIKSKHSDVEIPEDISFADFIFDGVHKHEDKTALVSIFGSIPHLLKANTIRILPF